MLAVQRGMDILRKATSYQESNHNIMRQPSAEDLDAAHQLVSSARGERNGAYVPMGASELDADGSTSPEISRAVSRESFSEHEKTARSSEGANVSGLEQICR